MSELWPLIVWPGIVLVWLIVPPLLKHRRERRSIRRAYFYRVPR